MTQQQQPAVVGDVCLISVLTAAFVVSHYVNGAAAVVKVAVISRIKRQTRRKQLTHLTH